VKKGEMKKQSLGNKVNKGMCESHEKDHHWVFMGLKGALARGRVVERKRSQRWI